MTTDVPEGIQREYPLARLTTIRTGGPAELFARPGTIAQLERVLAWAGEQRLDVGVVGSGSNLLVADAGVRGLVLKLDQELTQITVDGTRIDCGGGARLPAVSAQAARAGLSGIEFGVNIPGTVGGAVRMNANAYGGELARALEWVDVCSASGTTRRKPEELGFEYRRSALRPGEVVARAAFSLAPLAPSHWTRRPPWMCRDADVRRPAFRRTFGEDRLKPGLQQGAEGWSPAFRRPSDSDQPKPALPQGTPPALEYKEDA